MVRIKIILKIILLMVAIVTGNPLKAKTSFEFSQIDTSKSPILEMNADTVKLDQTSGLTHFFGNVRLAFGSLKIESDQMIITFEDNLPSNTSLDNKIKQIIAEGNVVLVNHKSGAKGDKASFDLEKNMLTLMGNILISTKQNALSGNKLVINFNNGNAEITGNVKSIFIPKIN